LSLEERKIEIGKDEIGLKERLREDNEAINEPKRNIEELNRERERNSRNLSLDERKIEIGNEEIGLKVRLRQDNEAINGPKRKIEVGGRDIPNCSGISDI